MKNLFLESDDDYSDFRPLILGKLNYDRDALEKSMYESSMRSCGKPRCMPPSPLKREIKPITVEDKRSMVYKIWTKNKNLIMIIGALGIGYFAYKKFIKK